MTIIAHLSDTHFGTEVPEVVSSLREYIRALKPDIAVISGDLTQRARASQFEAAQQFAQSLGVTTLLLPGNHDIPLYDIFTRFTNPYRLYKKFCGRRQMFWCNSNLGILCLDATNPFRHTRGKLDLSETRRLLSNARQEMPNDAHFLVAVHQPLVVTMPQDIGEALINAADVAALFSEYRVDAVLSGHVHMPYIATTTQHFKNLTRGFILSTAGTALSHRTRPGAPNSFNLIELNEGRLQLSVQAWALENKSFEQIKVMEFISETRGWRNNS